VSITDGRSGHYLPEYAQNPQALIDRRLTESANAANVIGATWGNLGVPDGAVYVNAQTTEAIVRAIRTFEPDLVLTNRPVDYHRDHRYGAQMVLDASYILTVPLLCPDTPALDRMPVIAYWHDHFTEAAPFRADVIVAVDSVLDEMTLQFGAHESQVWEWLPYNRGELDKVPATLEERLAWLRSTWIEPRGARTRADCAESLHSRMPHGHFVEAFQISEYGRRPSKEELSALFPV